jgi:hypothetical protein
MMTTCAAAPAPIILVDLATAEAHPDRGKGAEEIHPIVEAPTRDHSGDLLRSQDLAALSI